MSVLAGQLAQAVEGSGREELTASLTRQRWFGSKGRRIIGVRLLDSTPLSEIPHPAVLAILSVDYADGATEQYLVPLIILPVQDIRSSAEQTMVSFRTHSGIVAALDATDDQPACMTIFEGIRHGQTWHGTAGRFVCTHTPAFEAVESLPLRHVKRIAAEQSNTSLVYDDRAILKLIRKLEAGVNPDCEILEFLTTRTSYQYIPALIGHIRYDHALSMTERPAWSATVAVLQQFIPNEGDGWTLVVRHLESLREDRSRHGELTTPAEAQAHVRTFSRDLLSRIRRLGEITAGLHVALASDRSSAAFRPEPITSQDVTEWQKKMDGEIRDVMQQLSALTGPAFETLDIRRDDIVALGTHCRQKTLEAALLTTEQVMKIRVHGDYHLGQVLGTVQNFMILDFEGEPARALDERRAKTCALKDVAGMLRSFNYAVHAGRQKSHSRAKNDRMILDAWEKEATQAFLTGYRTTATPGEVGFLPASAESMERLLNLYQLEKAVYELRYELNHRPDWVSIPLQGLRRLVDVVHP